MCICSFTCSRKLQLDDMRKINGSDSANGTSFSNVGLIFKRVWESSNIVRMLRKNECVYRSYENFATRMLVVGHVTNLPGFDGSHFPCRDLLFYSNIPDL